MASIQKRPDGVWRARYRDEAGKEHARHFPRRVDAQRWLDEVTASVVTGMYVDPKAGKITFKSYVRDWSARQVWEATTRTSFNTSMATVPFGDLPMASIRRSTIESWVKSMVGIYAASTIHTKVVHVRQVFRAAVKDKVIAVDPTEDVVLPRQRRAEAAMVIPSPGEVAALLDAADDYFRPFVALLAFAGLRRAEASALQLDDVDFLGRRIHVRRQRQRDEVRLPKYGSERTIAVPDDLVTMLSVHVGLGVVSEGWLFVGERGPAGDNWANAKFMKTRRKAGVQGVTMHSLRHFYASGLIAAGCDVVTVQRNLGHASASTTLNIYSHLWPSADDRTRSAARSIMQEVRDAADSVRTDQGRNHV